MQSNFQQKQERDRKDLEQAHMKIVKQLESRLYEMEGGNKVSALNLNFNIQEKNYRSGFIARIWKEMSTLQKIYS